MVPFYGRRETFPPRHRTFESQSSSLVLQMWLLSGKVVLSIKTHEGYIKYKSRFVASGMRTLCKKVLDINQRTISYQQIGLWLLWPPLTCLNFDSTIFIRSIFNFKKQYHGWFSLKGCLWLWDFSGLGNPSNQRNPHIDRVNYFIYAPKPFTRMIEHNWDRKTSIAIPPSMRVSRQIRWLFFPEHILLTFFELVLEHSLSRMEHKGRIWNGLQ